MDAVERIYEEVVEAVVRPCGCSVVRNWDPGVSAVVFKHRDGSRERLYVFGDKEEFLMGKPEQDFTASRTGGVSAFECARMHSDVGDSGPAQYYKRMAALAGCRSLEEIEVRLAAIG